MAVALLTGLAVTFAQPRALPSGALIAGFFLLSTAVHALRLAWVRGGRSRRRAVTWVSVVLAAAVLLLAAAWLVIYHAFDVANRPVSDHLNGPQATATMTFWQALLGVLAQLPRLGTDGPGIPAVLLGLTLSVGIVWCLRVRALRWLAASGLASVLLYALAAGSNSVFAKLATGIWYKDAFRLAAMVALVGVPLVAFVLARCVAACRGAAAGWVRVGVPVLAAVLVVGSGWVAVVSSVPSAMGKVFALTDSAKADGGRLRDARQAAFLERVGDIVPAGERVLGDPWDGSTLVWLYGGREPVFPHVNGQWDADRTVLLTKLSEVGSDPAVCDALGRLDVHYVLYNPTEFQGGDPAGNVFGSIHAAVKAGVFTDVVAADGPNVLFRISACDG